MPRKSAVPIIEWLHTSREWADYFSKRDKKLSLSYIWEIEKAVLLLVDNPLLKVEVRAEFKFPDTKGSVRHAFSLAHNAQNFVRETLGLEYVGMTSTDFFKRYAWKEISKADKDVFWRDLPEKHREYVHFVKPKSGEGYNTIKPSALTQVVSLFEDYKNSAIANMKLLRAQREIPHLKKPPKITVWSGDQVYNWLDPCFGGLWFEPMGGWSFRSFAPNLE